MAQGRTAVRINVEVPMARRLLEAQQHSALLDVGLAAVGLRMAQTAYENAVLTASDLGCGSSAIGKAADLNESTIRGFLRRRRKT